MSQETEAARLVARVRADISQYEREMQRANQTMDNTARDMGRKAGTAARNTARGMDLLGKAVAGAFTVASLRKVVDYANKLAQLNDHVTQVRGNYARMLEGGDVAAGLRELRAATGGGADNLFLMEASSRLIAVHLADSNQEAAELLRASAQLGKFAKGYTAQQSVEQLLPLLSNQSALRLDEFGLSGDRVKKLADKYEAAGMESGAAFKRAFLEEAAATLQAIGAQVVTETERLAAAWANAQAGVAQVAGAGLLGQAYQWARGVTADILGGVGDYFQNLAERRAQIDAFVAQIEAMKDAGVLAEAEFWALKSSLIGLNAEIEFSNMSQEELASRLQTIVNTGPRWAAAFADWENSIRGVDSATSDVAARLEQIAWRKYVIDVELRLRGGNRWVNELLMEDPYHGQQVETAMPYNAGQVQPWWRLEEDPGDVIARTANELDDAAQAADRYALSTMEAADQVAELRRQQELIGWKSAEWHDLQDQIDTLLAPKSRGGGGISDHEKRLREYESELRSAASAAFATSSVTPRDWWETNLGQYQDKPDEYLRRLRSAMTDPESAWKDLLGGRTGDAAELYAAQQEELWRTGQWSQMGPGFDAEGSRGAIIEQMIQRINADRSRQAMIESLIRDPRLQALGMSASELTAITGSPMAAAGVDQMNTLVTAAGSVNVGQQLSEEIDKQFRSTEDLWVAMGETAMGWFTSGFTTLAPEIAAALAQTLLGPLLDEMERTGVRERP